MKAILPVIVVIFLTSTCLCYGAFEVTDSEVIGGKALLRLEYTGTETHNRCDIFYTDNLLSGEWVVYSRITFTPGLAEELELSNSGFYYISDGYIDSDGDGLSDSEEKLIWHTDPLNADTDGDGLSDYAETKVVAPPGGGVGGGTRVNGGITGDSWLYVDCNGYDMDVEVYGEHRVIIPKGSGKVFVEVIVFSGEYPVYTGKPSIYNDRVTYRIEIPDWVIWQDGDYRVNNLHNSFYSPGRFPGGNWEAFLGSVDFSGLTLEGDSYLDFYGSAMNARDNLLGSGVYLGLVVVPKMRMTTDYNHNRMLDEEDSFEAAKSEGVYYFWVNNDCDEGDISEGDEDIPSYSVGMLGGGNCVDGVVNGRSDMHDFFPVWLEIAAVVRKFGTGPEMRYLLKHADDGLNGVYTDLSVDEAGKYLTVEEERYGSNMDRKLHEADVFCVTKEGVELERGFLEKVKGNGGKGVILFEGRKKSKAPLVLEVIRKDTVLGECKLGLSIDNVEKMYRWMNIRGDVGGEEERGTDLSEPANYPDVLCEEKNFIFVHGYSVDEESARGWNAEMFKRLYWSGSKARYVAVTWFGNDSQKWWLGDATPDYHVNVIHALDTAVVLASNVNERIMGNKVIAGHSLGNMVVSSAIVEHGLQVDKYMIWNGAVAAEAYDGSVTQDIRMVHEWWRDYDERAWSANWYKLFENRDDARKKLTWRDKFTDVTFNTKVWNFYSEGDEVFELTEVHGLLTGVFDIRWWFIIPVEWNVDFGRHAWQKQEIFKGTKYQDSLLGIGATKYAGWGFECALVGPDEEGKYHLEPLYTPKESRELEGDHLRFFPVFRHYPEWLTDMSELSQAQINAMLAKGIPALTPAIGGIRMNEKTIVNERQGNINGQDYKPNGWPMRPRPDYQNWLHSDIKNVAYYYTYKFFDKVVQEGEIK